MFMPSLLPFTLFISLQIKSAELQGTQYNVNGPIDRPNSDVDFNYDSRQNFNPNVNDQGEIDRFYNGDIRQLLQALDLQASQQCTNNVAAQWNFETNVNQATQLEAVSLKIKKKKKKTRKILLEL